MCVCISSSVMVFNSSTPDEHQLNTTENITDASPVNHQTTVTLAQVLPSTTQHPETTALHQTSFTTIHLTTQRPETTDHLTRPSTGTQKSPPTSAAVIISSPAQPEARVDTPSALNVGDDGTWVRFNINLRTNMSVHVQHNMSHYCGEDMRLFQRMFRSFIR